MSSQITLTQLTQPLRGQVSLPASKSESNRVLIMQALAAEKIILYNLSEARDTQTMQRLLASSDPEWDVLDAGTTMRFLIAYCSVNQIGKVLKGTPRMHQRPVKLLVEALRDLGAHIDYLGEEGFPPVHAQGIPRGQQKNRVSIRGDVSSQYISALLMIAPALPDGLTLVLTGKVGSRPYIQMTLDLMHRFGIDYTWDESNVIRIEAQPYQSGEYTVESDWSGASYWYSLVALADEAEITLLGLREDSFQGDRVVVEIMEKLGVQTEFVENGVRLTKQSAQDHFQFDFSDCPDLAQTVAVTCAAKNIPCTMTGLESLRIKETDRIAALQQQLQKVEAKLEEAEPTVWQLTPSETELSGKALTFETYDDHRMAMAFAPLVTQADVIIQHPDVVQKSYPRFWEDLAHVGVTTDQQK